MKKLLLFGAGKIGRSFIAPIFENSGYAIVFVDVDSNVVDLINKRGSYKVNILDSNHPEKEKEFTVQNISALHLSESEIIQKQIVDADIIVTSIGKRGLPDLAIIIVQGLNKRFNTKGFKPVDIIFAENVDNAAGIFRDEIKKYLPNVQVDKLIGLVETSIGKMVPIMTEEQLRNDPLAIFAEPYKKLIVDELGFVNGVPEVKRLSPKKNMKAWVDRKIFIHNMGHAVLAYQTNFADPSIKYTWEALENQPIKTTTRNAMLQSAEILKAKYPYEFTKKQLEKHIEDLIDRFSNRALGDTIFRVGCDIGRKLNSDDRLMIPILAGFNSGKDYSLILDSWVKGCYFKGKDEQGKYFSEDEKFRTKFKENPITVLQEHCTLDKKRYALIYKEVQRIQEKIEKENALSFHSKNSDKPT